ncbi:MAG: NAD(P)-dependent oxidoreductase [Candidatus Manganitrophaceae bacterium]|nr:MAG: NAD(P)-dependent oxidoreductase [Candidatus Manganitrophaceae bacterium]
MEKSAFRIGMVGIGRMGANMARRLKEKGYALAAVYDIDPIKARSLAAELGCSAAETPAGAAKGSNTVITVVTDDAAMRHIFSESDPESLLQFGEGRLFINCATLSPWIHVEIEERARKRGGQTLEACMASSIPQAREGTLYLMCGGAPEAFERAKPLLESLGRSIRYIGKAGEAAKVKALVNMVMNINTAALAEGLGLGAALGLDLTLLREVFSQTGAASRVLETDGADMQKRDHECYFSAEHAAKDSGIALRLAEDQGLRLPLAKATFEQYGRLVEIGKGALDKSAVAELTFPGRS